MDNLIKFRHFWIPLQMYTVSKWLTKVVSVLFDVAFCRFFRDKKVSAVATGKVLYFLISIDIKRVSEKSANSVFIPK